MESFKCFSTIPKLKPIVRLWQVRSNPLLIRTPCAFICSLFYVRQAHLCKRKKVRSVNLYKHHKMEVTLGLGWGSRKLWRSIVILRLLFISVKYLRFRSRTWWNWWWNEQRTLLHFVWSSLSEYTLGSSGMPVTTTALYPCGWRGLR